MSKTTCGRIRRIGHGEHEVCGLMGPGGIWQCAHCEKLDREKVPASVTRYYAVTGRICGDEEDTLLLVTAAEHDEAVEAFKTELRAIRNMDPEDQNDAEIFIGAVVWSQTPIFE